jgi:hypothetical protein
MVEQSNKLWIQYGCHTTLGRNCKPHLRASYGGGVVLKIWVFCLENTPNHESLSTVQIKLLNVTNLHPNQHVYSSDSASFLTTGVTGPLLMSSFIDLIPSIISVW